MFQGRGGSGGFQTQPASRFSMPMGSSPMGRPRGGMGMNSGGRGMDPRRNYEDPASIYRQFGIQPGMMGPRNTGGVTLPPGVAQMDPAMSKPFSMGPQTGGYDPTPPWMAGQGGGPPPVASYDPMPMARGGPMPAGNDMRTPPGMEQMNPAAQTGLLDGGSIRQWDGASAMDNLSGSGALEFTYDPATFGKGNGGMQFTAASLGADRGIGADLSLMDLQGNVLGNGMGTAGGMGQLDALGIMQPGQKYRLGYKQQAGATSPFRIAGNFR